MIYLKEIERSFIPNGRYQTMPCIKINVKGFHRDKGRRYTVRQARNTIKAQFGAAMTNTAYFCGDPVAQPSVAELIKAVRTGCNFPLVICTVDASNRIPKQFFQNKPVIDHWQIVADDSTSVYRAIDDIYSANDSTTIDYILTGTRIERTFEQLQAHKVKIGIGNSLDFFIVPSANSYTQAFGFCHKNNFKLQRT